LEKSESLRDLLRLFDDLLDVMERLKRIKSDNVPTNLVFEIVKMTENNKSKIFSESASWVSPDLKNALLEQGLIQRIASVEGEKCALTLAGVARCIQIKYGFTLEKQYLGFLSLSDQKHNTVDQTRFLWDEKLASLSFILLGSTSAVAAIRLNNEQNKIVLTEVFGRVLDTMKKYGMIKQEEELRSVSRGETPVSAMMSRLYTLPRKTNQYYRFIGKGSEYYFDLEANGSIDDRKLSFLLGRVFERFDPQCDYNKMYSELSRISQSYYPRFLARSANPKVILSVLGLLKEFMVTEILHLPQKQAS
jgi:hypothetical protein